MDDEPANRLSQAEWEYVSKVEMTVGCITPRLMGLKQDDAADNKRYRGILSSYQLDLSFSEGEILDF
jgi:hypothetical protein